MFSFCELKIVLNTARLFKSILLVEKSTVLVFFEYVVIVRSLNKQKIESNNHIANLQVKVIFLISLHK